VTTDRLSSDTPTLGSVKTVSTIEAPAANAHPAVPPKHPVARWIAWGPGSSAALSGVCFVLILGAAIGFQHAGEKPAAAREETPPRATMPTAREHSALSGVDAPGSGPPAVAMPVAAEGHAAPAPTVEATLAHARACAAAARWNCVLDAASSVLAIQEGNSEAQSLLQRAIVHGGWATATSSLTPQAAMAASSAAATATPVTKSHARRHWHTASRKKSPETADTAGDSSADE
jgi:hypothetical protein